MREKAFEQKKKKLYMGAFAAYSSLDMGTHVFSADTMNNLYVTETKVKKSAFFLCGAIKKLLKTQN